MRFNVGNFQIDLVIQDWFRLDGGIIFSGIPGEKWRNFSMGLTTLIDPRDRVQLSVNCFLITTPDNMRILIDASFGEVDLWKPETVDAFHMQKGFNLFECSNSRRLLPPDLVIPTHLHFDHAGGLVKPSKMKGFIPVFPSAAYIFHKDEVKHALEAHPKTRSSYLRETITGLRFLLERASVMTINARSLKLIEGVTLIKTRGHTPGHMAVKIESEGETIFIPGGLCPTRWHANVVTCGVGNDTHGLEATDNKVRFLAKAVKEKWLLLLEHDPDVAGYVAREGKERFIFTPIR